MEELEEQNKLKFSDHYDDMELMKNKNQSRLLASAELGEGVFNLAVLQPTPFSPDTPQTQQYKVMQVQLNVKELLIGDKINLNEQSQKVIHRDLVKATANANRYKKLYEKVEKQLRFENSLIRGKEIKIDTLQDKVQTLSNDPEDSMPVSELLKNNAAEIGVLNKKINIPALEHPQTFELQTVLEEKEELNRKIMNLHGQVNGLKGQIESLEKQKKQVLVPILLVFIKQRMLVTQWPG